MSMSPAPPPARRALSTIHQVAHRVAVMFGLAIEWPPQRAAARRPS